MLNHTQKVTIFSFISVRRQCKPGMSFLSFKDCVVLNGTSFNNIMNTGTLKRVM
jgi:hypothetical protein